MVLTPDLGAASLMTPVPQLYIDMFGRFVSRRDDPSSYNSYFVFKEFRAPHAH